MDWERVKEAFGHFGIEGMTLCEESQREGLSQFVVELPPGMRVAKLGKEASEVAVSLGARSVRINRSKGERQVRIEIAHGPVRVHSVWHGLREWKAEKENLPLLVGMDGYGRPRMLDLVHAPHLLVAGATNSGKSVLMHVMLISLLSRLPARALRLMLLDPKQVEFRVYKELPHLVGGIAGEPREARKLLTLAASEMEARYQDMRRFAPCRDRVSYNGKVAATTRDTIPALVIMIDEYAELVSADPAIEPLVLSLVRKGRAAGIHLILATQRPVVEVVTGEIKANVPMRIALRMASATDSRVVLDTDGAEQLAGGGEMLLRNPDGVCERLQGYLVTEQDLEYVQGFFRKPSGTVTSIKGMRTIANVWTRRKRV